MLHRRLIYYDEGKCGADWECKWNSYCVQRRLIRWRLAKARRRVRRIHYHRRRRFFGARGVVTERHVVENREELVLTRTPVRGCDVALPTCKRAVSAGCHIARAIRTARRNRCHGMCRTVCLSFASERTRGVSFPVTVKLTPALRSVAAVKKRAHEVVRSQLTSIIHLQRRFRLTFARRYMACILIQQRWRRQPRQGHYTWINELPPPPLNSTPSPPPLPLQLQPPLSPSASLSSPVPSSRCFELLGGGQPSTGQGRGRGKGRPRGGSAYPPTATREEPTPHGRNTRHYLQAERNKLNANSLGHPVQLTLPRSVMTKGRAAMM